MANGAWLLVADLSLRSPVRALLQQSSFPSSLRPVTECHHDRSGGTCCWCRLHLRRTYHKMLLLMSKHQPVRGQLPLFSERATTEGVEANERFELGQRTRSGDPMKVLLIGANG